MNRVEKTHLPVAALTHPGMKGKNNEDRFGVSAFRMKTRPVTPVLLAVLADGIGGHRAGEVASELAVNTISQYAASSDGFHPTQTLEQAIHFANQAIFEQAQSSYEHQGMGATCACAWIAGDRLYTATIGDSRVYLMRENAIHQLSTDHTWIQEALERGLIQPDQVEGHPNAHVIRRYLGAPTPPEVDFRIRSLENPEEASTAGQGMQLLPGDFLLLCTDGLTDLVSDEEILHTITRETLEVAGQQLVTLANERGGHDNITLIAVQVPVVRAGGVLAGAKVPGQRPQAAAANPPTDATMPVSVGRRSRLLPRGLLAGCLAVILLAVLVGGIAGGWLLFAGREQPTVTPTSTLVATLSLPGSAATTAPAPTRTPTRTLTRTRTVTPFEPLAPGQSPSLTPWRLNTPTPDPNRPLPIVTVAP